MAPTIKQIVGRCESLLEPPMLQSVLTRHKLPCTAKYVGNTGKMAPIREQAGTFADSIKLRIAT